MSDKIIDKFEVGQTVWVQYMPFGTFDPNKHKGRYEVITKVGSKYYSIGKRKFYKDLLTEADEYGHCELYKDEEEFHKSQKRYKMINDLRQHKLGKATYEQLIEIYKILGRTPNV